MFLTVLLALLGTAPAALAEAPAATPGPLRKISILESTNLKLDDRYRTLKLRIDGMKRQDTTHVVVQKPHNSG